VQTALAHSVLLMQDWPAAFLQLPAPSHELTPVHVLGLMLSGPAGMFPQVPFTPVAHDLQAGQLATPQQTPSTHIPDDHSSVKAQLCPLTFLQLPDPSHELAPVQVLGETLSGTPLAMFPQVPFPPSAHDWHAGQLATPQQTPSIQLAFTHCDELAQGCPAFFSQLPFPSHELTPVHCTVAAVSGRLMATLPQTPSAPPPFFAAEQARHVPLQVVLQQTPSAQLPLTQSMLPLQVCPSIFLQLLAPSHALGELQMFAGNVSG
jgi:hypothetical protein